MGRPGLVQTTAGARARNSPADSQLVESRLGVEGSKIENRFVIIFK